MNLTRGFSLAGACCLIWGLNAPASHGDNFSGRTASLGCTAINVATKYDNVLGFLYIDLETESINATTNIRHSQYDFTNEPTERVWTEAVFLNDINVRDQPYDDYCGYDWWKAPGNGEVIVLAVCDYGEPDASCSRHTVRYTTYWMQHPNTSWDEKRHLACHEIGHAYGLKHKATGCMEQGVDNFFLGAHNLGHINGYY